MQERASFLRRQSQRRSEGLRDVLWSRDDANASFQIRKRAWTGFWPILSSNRRPQSRVLPMRMLSTMVPMLRPLQCTFGAFPSRPSELRPQTDFRSFLLMSITRPPPPAPPVPVAPAFAPPPPPPPPPPQPPIEPFKLQEGIIPPPAPPPPDTLEVDSGISFTDKIAQTASIRGTSAFYPKGISGRVGLQVN